MSQRRRNGAALLLLASCGMPTEGSPIPPAPPSTPPPQETSDAGTGEASTSHPPQNDAAQPPPPPPPPHQDGGATCYSERWSPTASIADLEQAYAQSAWLTTSMEVMHRRLPVGFFVLDGEKTDPQLQGFADPSSFANLMTSLMTMVHEESHGWDFDNSRTAGQHTYVLRDDLQLTVPEIANWQRSEILPLITDDSTSSYDQTYLTGTQGTYDFIFLAEELNAYTNGLAAINAVAETITSAISARDGVACSLLYLELFLRVGRTSHAAEYAALKADVGWQKLVRYAWARGFLWDARAQPYPNLDIASGRIWAHVNEAANLDEIKEFTGQDPKSVACSP